MPPKLKRAEATTNNKYRVMPAYSIRRGKLKTPVPMADASKAKRAALNEPGPRAPKYLLMHVLGGCAI